MDQEIEKIADSLKGKTRAELEGLQDQTSPGLRRTGIGVAIERLNAAEKKQQFRRSLIVALVPAVAAWVAAIAAVVTAFRSGQRTSQAQVGIVQLTPSTSPILSSTPTSHISSATSSTTQAVQATTSPTIR